MTPFFRERVFFVVKIYQAGFCGRLNRLVLCESSVSLVVVLSGLGGLLLLAARAFSWPWILASSLFTSFQSNAAAGAFVGWVGMLSRFCSSVLSSFEPS